MLKYTFSVEEDGVKDYAFIAPPIPAEEFRSVIEDWEYNGKRQSK